MDPNNLKLEVYSTGLSQVIDAPGELLTAEGISFSTGYPGGLYLDASFEVQRNTADFWALKGAQRVVIRNSQTIVWEGQISGLDRSLQQETEGIKINAVGYWASLMNARRWRKWWADDRIQERRSDVWFWNETKTAAELADNDRDNRIRITPKAEAWANNDEAAIEYAMPTGETIKRVTLDFDFQEAGQAWELSLRNVGGGSAIWSKTASGSGSQDDTLSPASNGIALQFFARAAQTPPSDGTIYGEISNVVVYSETGAINLTEIAKDIRAEVTELNSDEGNIDSNTLALVPFIADRWETMGEILSSAARFGDASQNRWAYGVLSSEAATTPDGKPVLFVEQYPVLTGFDYAIRLDESNLQAPIRLTEDFIGADVDDVWNWIIVKYTDLNGSPQWESPDDDANLTDADSVADWGQREIIINAGESTTAQARLFGRRFLKAHKDPAWRMTRPIKVMGSIRTDTGGRVPASEIRAGRRLKIENFLSDLSGTGLTVLISRTDWDDTRELMTITSGMPTGVDLLLAQRELIDFGLTGGR